MRSLCFPWILLLLISVWTWCENRLLAQDCTPFYAVSSVAALPEAVANNAVCNGSANGNNYVYSFAGIDTSKSHTGIHLKSWRYDVTNDLWEALPDLPDTLGKVAAGASYLDGIIYIVGGYHVFSTGSEVSSKRVHRFDCETNAFLPDAADLPLAIDDHVQAVWRDSLLYVITGWSNNANTSAVQVYDPGTDSWTLEYQIWNSAIYSSFGASGTIVGDSIYYFGGARFGASFPIQPYLRKGVIASEDPLNITWSHSETNPDAALYRSACIDLNGTAHWLGGSRATYNFDGIAYSNGSGVEPADAIQYVADTVMQINSCPSLLMDYRGAAWFPESGQLFLCGGMDQNQEVSNKAIMLAITPLSVGHIQDNKASMFHLYPNPAKQRFYLETNTPGRIQVYDSQGRLLQDFHSQKSPVEIVVSTGPTVLFVVVQTSAGTFRQKVLLF